MTAEIVQPHGAPPAGDQDDRNGRRPARHVPRGNGQHEHRRKADRLGFAYDDLETRIAEIAEAEGIAAVRPDLDGEQIMAILGIAPGREVGEAYRFLLELRLEEGPLGPEVAEERLKSWYSAR